MKHNSSENAGSSFKIKKLAALLLLSIFSFSSAAYGTLVDPLPKTVLWLWESPHDATNYDPKDVAVAYLLGSLHFSGNSVYYRSRLQPLRLSKSMQKVAVIRFEYDRRKTRVLTDEQLENAVSAAAIAFKDTGLNRLQIDFDARVSQRDFYRKFLSQLRKKIPADTHLSITALASWCMGDNWIKDLDVDEVVPMIFRMGPDGSEIVRKLKRGGDFTVPKCRISYGISTDEPYNIPFKDKRIYVFISKKNPRDVVTIDPAALRGSR